MRQLKAQGIALIYISHKMDEIFEICDEISVLRDGSLVMTKPSKETDMNELIAAMVGRSLDNRFPPVDNTPGETILSVQNISTKYAPKLQNISFDIKKEKFSDSMVWLVPVVPNFWRPSSEFVQEQKEISYMTEKY